MCPLFTQEANSDTNTEQKTVASPEANTTNTEQSSYVELLPEETSEIQGTLGTISIKTSIQKSEVFLNNEYQGVTPIIIKDLVPGTYKMNIKKMGYAEQYFLLTVENNKSASYYVEMIPVNGTLTFSTLPEGAKILIDGKSVDKVSVDSPLTLSEGPHRYEVSAFGYNKVSGNVTIMQNENTHLELQLASSDTKVTNFNVVKKEKKVFFTFDISSPTQVVLIVTDMKGNEIIKFEKQDFSDKKASIEWDKKDTNGKKVPNAAYDITLVYLDSKLTKRFTTK